MSETNETKRTQDDIVANMTNIADSGQDLFVQDQKELAKITLYEMGISKKFLDSEQASYILGKFVTDNVEDGNLSTTMKDIIATLRANHPHSEDKETENV